jgi:hypothetical protein
VRAHRVGRRQGGPGRERRERPFFLVTYQNNLTFFLCTYLLTGYGKRRYRCFASPLKRQYLQYVREVNACKTTLDGCHQSNWLILCFFVGISMTMFIYISLISVAILWLV